MELPGKSLLKAHHTGGESDKRAASAVWGAVGDVGEKLQGVGEAGMKLAPRQKKPEAAHATATAAAPADKAAQLQAKILEVTGKTKAAEASREIDERVKSYQAVVTQNRDMTEEQAEEGWHKFSKDLTEKYGSDTTSPYAVQSQSLILQGAAVARQTVGVARLQRVKLSAIQTVDLAVKSGDVGQLEQGLSVLKEFTPEEEYKVQHQQSYRRMQTYQVENSIGSNPFAMRDELAKPDFLKSHAHLTEDDLPRLQAKASGIARQSVGDAVNSFNQDLLSDKLKSKQDIARIYIGIAPPHVVEEMQNQYVQLHDPAQINLRKTPEYQRQKSGEVGRMLGSLSTSQGEDFEKNFTAAAFALSQLQDTAGKSYLVAKLDAARDGVTFRPKNSTQAAFADIDNYIARERGNYRGLQRAPDALHPGGEEEAISHQHHMDTRSGEMYDKLSSYFDTAEKPTSAEIEKKVLALHGEIVRANIHSLSIKTYQARA